MPAPTTMTTTMTMTMRRPHNLRAPMPTPCVHFQSRCPAASYLLSTPRRRTKSHPSKSSRILPCQSTGAAGGDIIAAVTSAHPGLLVGTIASGAVTVAGYKVLAKGLDAVGIVNAFVLGTLAFAAFGAGGYGMVCLYFLFGTAVTKVKLAQKEKEGIAEARGGKRTWRSVWGSGLAAAICAAFALATGSYETFAAGFAACFASKLGDTTSSEIGKAYGTRTYLSTTFREVPRGTEGAVSLEGSLAGVAAALAMSVVSLPLGLASSPSVAALVFVSAVIANYAESILGATVQTKSEESTGIVALLTNDVVNVLQTSLASLIAVLVCGNFV